jgi:hypothetical protein
MLEYSEVELRDVLRISPDEALVLLGQLLRMAARDNVTLVCPARGGPAVMVRCYCQPEPDWPTAIAVAAHHEHVDPPVPEPRDTLPVRRSRCPSCGGVYHVELGRLVCRTCRGGMGSTEEGGL